MDGWASAWWRADFESLVPPHAAGSVRGSAA